MSRAIDHLRSRTARAALRCVVVALVSSVHPAAHALKFAEAAEGSILIVYDCGNGLNPAENEKNCQEYQSGFAGPEDDGSYVGDAKVLDNLLSKKRSYSRVYLWSNGGDLNEGVNLGKVLRKYEQFVEVPKGGRCVSACTVAFLGGRIRDVDPDGSYEVHAYSRYSSLGAKQLQSIVASPDAEFAYNARLVATVAGAKFQAKNLLTYAQRMINGTPNEGAIDAIQATVPDYLAAYKSSGRFRSDLERINGEGAVTAQELLMQTEREAFNAQLAALKSGVATLGPRAANAIEMLEIMFSSRITGTHRLDQNILREKGYINVHR